MRVYNRDYKKEIRNYENYETRKLDYRLLCDMREHRTSRRFCKIFITERWKKLISITAWL